MKLKFFLAIGFLGFWVGEAAAQELCNGRVCPEAFTCETYTSTCAEDDPNCVVFTDIYCQSPECEVDSDCPTGRRCRVSRYYDCVNPPTPGRPPDDAEGTPECPLVTESWCEPAYQLPCTTAEQCGEGFTCEPACDCNDPNVEPDCLCRDEEAGITGGCYTPVRACTATADCPTGWACIDNENGFCNVMGDLHSGCNAGDPPKVCVPPMFEGNTVADGDDDGSTTKAEPEISESGGCSLSAPGTSFGHGLVALVLALGLGVWSRHSARSRIARQPGAKGPPSAARTRRGGGTRSPAGASRRAVLRE